MLMHVCDICDMPIHACEHYISVKLGKAGKAFKFETKNGHYTTNEEIPFELCEDCFKSIEASRLG